MQHRCIGCGRVFGQGLHSTCDRCGSLVDVEYDPSGVRLRDSPNPYIRFSDLLPVGSMERRPKNAAYTPTVHARRLGEALGLERLYLKNETVLPTGTTKDRMAAVSLRYLRERGVRTFCASSTGNSSTAYAWAIRAHPDMHLVLFTAEPFADRVQFADHEQVTHYVLEGATFVEACEFALEFGRRNGLCVDRGFFNPGRREGLKLAFLEAAEQVPHPIDWYVQAVSSAMGVYGAHKGARELRRLGRLDRLPSLVCAQQEGCAPMVRAFQDGSDRIRPEHVVARPQGIADAILRGDPSGAYSYVHRIVTETGGRFVLAAESAIREARSLVQELEGISPCFSASTAVAGVVRLAREGVLPSRATVLINLTGTDRKRSPDSPGARRLGRGASGWTLDGEARAAPSVVGGVR